MKQSRLLQDILSQPKSLDEVLSYHSGPGRAALQNAAELLTSGKQVILTGMGASMYALTQLEYSLNSRNIKAFLVEAAELLHYRQQLCSDAVVLIVSRSGESVEVVRLLDALDGRARLIGVANDPESILARKTDVYIHIGSLPDEMVAIQSYTGTLLTMRLLDNAVTHQSLDRDRDLNLALAALPSLIANEVKTASKWDDLLKLGSPVYLLGRGPSYGSVLEGALLFHEISKAPAVGMQAASFRHGPVEIVDEQFVGVIFAAAGPTRNLNLGLARDIDCFGGHVIVIGPEDEDTQGLKLCPIAKVSETLAPLLEIVPVQCAAVRLAELRRLKIGSFRYTPQVTRDEASFAH